MKVFILAGGFATRLWPLTEKRAKPLLPLAGKPILTHLLEKIPTDLPVTVSTNAAFKDGFEKWQREINRKNLEILIEETHKDDHKLGALGAVAQWITDKKIDDDVLLLTGDNYIGFSMNDFLLAQTPGTALIAAHDIGDLERAKAFGTIILEDGTKRIRNFEEKPVDPKSTLVSTGCSILPKDTLPILCKYASTNPDNVGGIFEELLRRGVPVECFTFKETWLDIGSFGSYLDAHRLIVGNSVQKDASASVEECSLDGSISIGKDSKVIKSELTDTMIFENCVIEDCILRECIIDSGCHLKGVELRKKMLRSGTTLP